jgi:hypothetical protein
MEDEVHKQVLALENLQTPGEIGILVKSNEAAKLLATIMNNKPGWISLELEVCDFPKGRLIQWFEYCDDPPLTTNSSKL